MKKQPKTLAEAMRNPRFFFWPWMGANNIDEHGKPIVPAQYPKCPDICVVTSPNEEIRAANRRYDEIQAMFQSDLQTVFDYRISHGMPIIPCEKM